MRARRRRILKSSHRRAQAAEERKGKDVRPIMKRRRSRSSHSPCACSRASTPPAAPRASLSDTAVLAERARIARDLHDGVSQTLYAITLGVARARGLLQRNQADEAQRLIDDV